jgi:hypothetical protein
MNRQFLSVTLFSLCLLGISRICAEEAKPEILYTSPSGRLRLELVTTAGSGAEEEISDVWLVSSKDPSQRARLPKQEPDSPTDDEFHFSPNEEWLFGLRHVGSGLRYGNIYHLVGPSQIEPVGKPGFFNDLVWDKTVKLGALKEDFSAAGVYAMTFFVSWSLDSSHLLIRLCGGEEKRDMHCGALYFDTRAKKFELTDYLRKLNKAKSEEVAGAESVNPLPSEAELKAKYDALDKQLNRRYAEVLANTNSDQVPNLRDAERHWIKQRDEGAKAYLAFFPPTEKERRRLEFFCTVTEARIETQPAEAWEN